VRRRSILELEPSESNKEPDPTPPENKPRISWKGFLMLVVIWISLSLWFRVSTITFLLPSSLILIAFFRTNRTQYKKAHSKTFAYFSLDKGVEIFSCLAIVVGFYLAASWVFDDSSDQSTLAYLWQLEDRFTHVKEFLSSYVIFKPWISGLLIAMLIMIDLLYSYVVGFDPAALKENVHDDGKHASLVSRYLAFQKLSKRAYIVLVFLCSFSFFGNAVVGEKIARVQVKIEKIRTGYEEARTETEAALSAAVQERLLQQIDNNIFVGRTWGTYDFKYYHDIVYTYNSNLESLRKTYSNARSTPNVVIEGNFEARVRQATSRAPPAYDGPQPVPYSDDLAGDVSDKTETLYTSESRPAGLKDLTLEKVEEAKSSLKNRAKLRRSISAIKLADGTEILVQLPKSFTKVIKGAVFSDFTKRFPFLEPMFDGLVSAFDKTMEEKIKAKAGPALDKFLDHWFPGRTLSRSAFEDEAREIVDSSQITLTSQVIDDTKASAYQLTRAIGEIDTLTKELEARIESAKVSEHDRLDLRTLPEPTCVKSAMEQYVGRLKQAKTLEDMQGARDIFDYDLKRLKERESSGIAKLKPG